MSLARAADYVVNNMSPACSDVGPGTQAMPYCSISAALAAHHTPGTTINVMPGTYHEQVTVPAPGASGSPIILKALGAPGFPVVVDGSDDFSDLGLWVPFSGDVWLASSVTWSPLHAYADGARLAASPGPPEALPPGSFLYVAGTGLYVNAWGGNPGTHHTLVGHRPFGFYVSGRSWVTIDGFTVTRCEDRGIQLTNASSQIAVLRNIVSFCHRFGIQASGCSAVRIASNVVSDNGDHGISLVAGTTGSVIEDNESFRNVFPATRQANGLYLFGCPNNLIQRNRFHDNQDTGLQLQSGSNNNLSIQNMSWNNGDHGYDHLLATGNVHIGDVAYGNYKDGFSIEGNSTGQQLYDCIAVDNGLTTNEFDLWVDLASSAGFVSDYNLFWNSTSQPPVKYIATLYASVAGYSAASGHDTRTIQADPRFVGPAHGDFHLLPGSPAIDNANSNLPSWPASDAQGGARVDDPATPNRGLGPVRYADRGALEYLSAPGNLPPVAMLSVTPSSGPAPLTVTADASRSYDPNGTVASYVFDFGDGTVVGPQSSPTATHDYPVGLWTARVIVTDLGGAIGSASVPVTATGIGPNLVGNPSFETGTAGWATVGNATMHRVAGGADGSYALELQGSSSRHGGDKPWDRSNFGVTDEPDWVRSTPAGAHYHISTWVRSVSSTGQCAITVEERGGRRSRWTTSSSPVTLSPSWQPITLEVFTHAAGSSLDLQIVDQPVVRGESFQVDNVSIQLQVGGLAAGIVAPGVAPDALAPEAAPDEVTPGVAESAAGIRVGVSPNPFRNAAQLAFATSRSGPVSIGLYDVSGRAVRTLLNQVTMSTGLHTVPVDGRRDDGSRLEAGLYFYQIRTTEGFRTGRFVVMK